MTHSTTNQVEHKRAGRVPRLTAVFVPTVIPQWTLSQVATYRCPLTWEDHFKNSMDTLAHVDRFLALPEQVSSGFYPGNDKVFDAFRATPIDTVEVVLLGMDPYHNEHADGERPRAQGLSFSVDSYDTTPPSMHTIMKEVESNYPECKRQGAGNLLGWAMQGVLLLNAALTVAPGQPGSHLKKDVWRGFLIKTLRFLAEKRPGCTYMLWGADAKEFEKLIDSKAIILTAGHPSPQNRTKPFAGCGHFRECNKILASKKKPAIDWTIY